MASNPHKNHVNGGVGCVCEFAWSEGYAAGYTQGYVRARGDVVSSLERLISRELRWAYDENFRGAEEDFARYVQMIRGLRKAVKHIEAGKDASDDATHARGEGK
jgi:hypothetical protein